MADRLPRSTVCGAWPASISATGDEQCLTPGSDTTGPPGVLTRGGAHTNGTGAGPLAVFGGYRPSDSFPTFGFRCAR